MNREVKGFESETYDCASWGLEDWERLAWETEQTPEEGAQRRETGKNYAALRAPKGMGHPTL